jgi:hypothetical protein
MLGNPMIARNPLKTLKRGLKRTSATPFQINELVLAR